MSEQTFERDLRAVLHDLAPADVPASLREAVAAVPLTRPVPPRALRRIDRPRLFAFAGLAAVVVAAIGLALALGGRPSTIAGPSPSGALPSGAPTAWVKLTYQIVDPSKRTLSATAAVSDVMGRRLAGQIPATITSGEGTISVTVPAERSTDAENLIGTTGKVDFVPMGTRPPSDGETVDLSANPPLFSNEGVASAAVGVDQVAARTVDITLTPTARDAFATYTANHIGDYLAIVLDGKVLTAPVIQSSIPNGQVQVRAPGVGGWDLNAASRMVAVLGSGPLPYPVRELSSEPASAPSASLSTPLPATPYPSTTPSATPAATPSSSSAVGTNLTVAPLAGAPTGIGQIVHWSGGYAAVAVNPPSSDIGSSLWTSPDGLTWSPMRSGPVDAQGASTSMLFMATCRSGLLVLGADPSGSLPVSTYYTTDGSTWASSTIRNNLLGSPDISDVAGGDNGAVAVGGAGRAIESSDCTSWRGASLGAQDPFAARGIGIVGKRFVLTGYTGDPATNARVDAIAWWSDDLASWHPVHPATLADQGFGSVVASDGPLLVAEMTYPGYVPGQRSWWATADGVTWRELSAPLGVYTDGAGAGSVAGSITGSGGSVFDFGVPRSIYPGAIEVWVTSDGRKWTKLAIGGSAAATTLNSDNGYHPLVVPGHLLFSSQTGPTMVATTAVANP